MPFDTGISNGSMISDTEDKSVKDIIRYMLQGKITVRKFILWSGLAAIIWLIVAILFQIFRIFASIADNLPMFVTTLWG